MMKLSLSPLAWLAVPVLAASAIAQDFNVKCGPFTGVPSSAFGAASGQTGLWNAVSMGQASVPLVDLQGQPTGAVAVPNGCDNGSCSDCGLVGACGAFPFGPDEAALLLSWMNGDCLDFNRVRVTGLEPAEYRVHAYAYHPCNTTKTTGMTIRVLSASDVTLSETFLSIGGVEYQGTWTGFPIGIVTFAIQPGEKLEIRFAVGAGPVGGLCGFQLDRLDPTGTALCFGDGTGAACPCANSGLPGHGCKNSATIRGAELAAFGTASLASDTLDLACAFEPPGVTSIALQGDQLIAPTFFGDGLRCTGGNLKRLFVVSASPSGDVELPPLAGPSISARSAALGDTIQAGTSRWYQVYYRDPDTSFCPEPPGATFNVSNAIEIAWTP